MKLQASNVTFTYPGVAQPVLQNVSLTIESGERVGLCAPSGFGKTSLCKLLAGYETPHSGSVLLDGKPLPKSGYCPVQMIWQHPELAVNPRLKMSKILAEGGMPSAAVQHGVGLESAWLQRYPAELSGGELQRFCVARALHAQTQFLIADEISTMLDLITQAQLWSFLAQEAQTRNLGMLIVSHTPALLEKVCTRIVTLETE